MKKFWKSAAALLLCAAFGVSAACGVVDDSSGSGKGDSNSGEGTGVSSQLSRNYVTTALQEFAEAKNLTISVGGEVTVSYMEGTESVSEKYEVDLELAASFSDSGIAMKAEGTIDQTSEGQTVTEEIGYYIIDGIEYIYNSEGNYYTAWETEIPMDDIFDLFSGISEGLVSEDTVEFFAGLLDQYGTVTEDSATVSLVYDAGPFLNKVITTIDNFDETTTLETAINETLKLFGIETTVGDMLDSLKPLGAMTLSQLVFVADQILGEYNTSLREIKDTLVALEPVQQLINDAVAAGALTEQQAATVKTGTIAEILKQFNLENVTVDKLVALLFSAAGGGTVHPGDETPESPETQSEIGVDFDLAAAIDYLKAMLKEMTLSQLGMTFPDLDGFAFSKAEMGAELIIGKTEVEKLELNGEVGFAQTVGETSVGEIQAKVSYKIETNDSEISLPEDVKVIYWSYWGGDEDASRHIIVYGPRVDENGEYICEGYVEVTAGENRNCLYTFTYTSPISVNFTEITLIITGGTWQSGEEGGTFSETELKEIFGENVTVELIIGESGCDLSAFPLFEAETVYSVTL